MLKRLARRVPPVTRLYANIDRLADQLEALHHQVDSLRKRVDELAAVSDERARASSAELQALQVRAAELQAVAAGLQASTAETSGRVSELTGQVAAAQGDVTNLGRRVVRAERTLESGPTPSRGRREAPLQEGPARAGATGRPVPPNLYIALEDVLRGAPELIAEYQRTYVEYVESCDAQHPLVDLGAGRGEWLDICREAGIPAYGIDDNPAMVADAMAKHLDVRLGDLLTHVAGLDAASLGAVTMFQVVEHLPFASLVELFVEIERILVPGGLFIAETPNCRNLQVGTANFWLDPTHQRPVPPELLTVLASETGFARHELLFLHRSRPALQPGPDTPTEEGRVLADLAELAFGPQDVALLAWTAGHGG